MRREWTKAEERYMYRYYVRQPVETTAKKLNRTKSSVIKKAHRMGLNSYLDNVGGRTIARCFNVDFSVVERWVKSYELPVKRIKCWNQIRYSIDVELFWEWACEHKKMIDWSKYELKSLPPEPDWVREEKRTYKFVNHRRKISNNDKAAIRYILKKNPDFNYTQVGEKVGRTTESIRHIMKSGMIF